MTGHYDYPADEFDVGPHEERPRGVHRAPRSWWSRWAPFVVVLVLFPVLAFGAVYWLSQWDGAPGGGALPVIGSDDTPSDEPSEPVSEEPAAEEPAAEEPAVEEPAVETPAPQPDLATAVRVLNATNRSGLASGGAERLTEAGFTSASSGNWSGGSVSSSVVYHGVAEDAVTAQAVAAALGIARVELDEGVEGVLVVLANDYEG